MASTSAAAARLQTEHAGASTSSLAESSHSVHTTTTEVSSSLDTEDTAIPSLDSFPPTGTPKHEKLGGYDFYRSIGSPRKIVAPMVEGSELAWRVLSRRMGADLCYSPMINSKMYGGTSKGKGRPVYRERNFCQSQGEEGASELELGKAKDTDRPLFVQFCGNDPELLLESALDIQDRCDAVDLNLGCPQSIAKRGYYGAFLQEDWPLIFKLINTLHLNLKVPVTAKMRVFPSVERTVAYARMLERAGAQIIACHGRTREMKGHKTGVADWKKIAAVKQAVKVPVFANGNVLYPKDVEDALAVTGADGVMSAEGNLYNPAIFEPFESELGAEAGPSKLPLATPSKQYPFIPDACDEYLDIIVALKTPASPAALKSHIFKMTRPALEVHTDLRPLFGRARVYTDKEGEDRVKEYRAVVRTLRERLQEDMKQDKYLQPPEQIQVPEGAQGLDPNDPHRPPLIAHWLLQPYFRKPMPPEELQRQAQLKAAKQERREKHASRGRPVEIRDVQARGEEKVDMADDGDEDELANAASAKRKPDAHDASEAADATAPAEKKIKDLLDEAQELKTRANAAFSKESWDAAVALYEDAITLLPPRAVNEDADSTASEDGEGSTPDKGKGRATEEELKTPAVLAEEQEVAKLRAVLYCNMAACHLKLEQHKEAVAACGQALEDDPRYVKALHRRATANEQIGTWSGVAAALEDLKLLLTLSETPANLKPSIRSKIAQLEPLAKQLGEKEKDEMLGKLRGIGDSILGHFGLSTKNFQFTQGEGGGYSMNFVR